MANRIGIILFPLLVLCGSLVWLLGMGDPKSTASAGPGATPSLAPPVDTFPPLKATDARLPDQRPRQAPFEAGPSATQKAAEGPVTEAAGRPGVVVFNGPEGALTYTARAQDTLSELAFALFGADSKLNRDAVANANPTLQSNPDHVVVGRDYSVPTPNDRPARPSSPPMVPGTRARASGTEFQYTAARGDTVTRLAEAFLGGSTKVNRDAIINANPSLRLHPDQMLVGKAYRIVAPDGLSAVVPGVAVRSSLSSAFQPDADDVLADGSGRNLRYTARAGDTVTNLATALLGGDTEANRDAILNSNPALKAHPDDVIAGQTYWIPAPVAPGADAE